MPVSQLHEVLVDLFRYRPRLAPELLREVFNVSLPAFSDVRVESASLNQLAPVEFKADLVVLLVEGRPVHGVVIEVQLDRSERKRFVWPVYGTVLRSRFECGTDVLVVAVDEAVARWAAQPIKVGTASVFTPLVLGPHVVPVVRDPSAPAELAVLSAMAHGHDDLETAVQVALAATQAITRLDEDRRVVYFDRIMAALSDVARKEFLMLPQGYQYEYEPLRKSYQQGQAEGRAEGRAEGEAKGVAKAILQVLAARRIPVTPAQRARIQECMDQEQLDTWTVRAALVTTAAALFAPEPYGLQPER